MTTQTPTGSPADAGRIAASLSPTMRGALETGLASSGSAMVIGPKRTRDALRRRGLIADDDRMTALAFQVAGLLGWASLDELHDAALAENRLWLPAVPVPGPSEEQMRAAFAAAQERCPRRWACVPADLADRYREQWVMEYRFAKRLGDLRPAATATDAAARWVGWFVARLIIVHWRSPKRRCDAPWSPSDRVTDDDAEVNCPECRGHGVVSGPVVSGPGGPGQV